MKRAEMFKDKKTGKFSRLFCAVSHKIQNARFFLQKAFKFDRLLSGIKVKFV